MDMMWQIHRMRVLLMRLKEFKGFIEPAEEKRSPMIVQWRLTEKGKDTLPISMQLVFGYKWYFNVAFEDKVPRKNNSDVSTSTSKRNYHGYQVTIHTIYSLQRAAVCHIVCFRFFYPRRKTTKK
jgi:hypothetical protein